MNAAPALLRCRTDDLPLRDRIPIWCDIFGRVLLKLDFAPIGGRPFRQAADMYVLDGLGVWFGQTDGMTANRTRSQLADSNDDFIFHTNTSGFSLPYQRRREFRLEAGEAVLMTSGELGGQRFPEPAAGLTLRIPRRTLAALVRDPESALMRRLPAGTPALRLLADYVALVMDRHELGSAQLQRLFTTHVHDLVALVLGANRDAAELAQTRGLRAARLHAIKSDISQRFGDEGLSVGTVALRHGVTPRYVHMLFEAEEQTFSEFLIEQRLVQAHRMLTDPRLAARKISAIAFEVGFANLSYFNRLFRRRYGMAPSELRERAGSAGES